MLQPQYGPRVGSSRRHHTMLFAAAAILAPVVWALAWGQLPADSPTPAESRRLVQTVLDHGKPDGERFAAFARLLKAQPDDLKPYLQELLQSGDSSYSVQAAMSLLAFDNVDEPTKALVVKQIPKWLDGYRQQLLGRNSAGRNSPRLRFVPRAILEAVISGDIDPPKDVIVGSVEYAARILAFAYDPQDEALLQRAVLALPSSPSLWLALGRCGPLTPEHAKLAAEVMRDDSQPYLGRVAAAGALAQTDPEASEFVHAETRKFLEEFGPYDMTFSPWPRVSTLNLNDIPEERIRYNEKNTRYVRTIWLLGNLLNLDTPEAGHLTFTYLLAPDPKIRRALALVAVKRWPQRFLEETSADTWPMYEPQEYEMLLALIAYLHPHLRADVEKRIGSSMVEKLFQRIELGGPTWWCEEVGGFLKGW